MKDDALVVRQARIIWVALAGLTLLTYLINYTEQVFKHEVIFTVVQEITRVDERYENVDFHHDH